jgi:plastocyanin
MNRIVTLLLVGSSLVLAAALSACGGDDEQQAAAPAAKTAAAKTATPAATKTPADNEWPDGEIKPAKAGEAEEPAAAEAASESESASAEPVEIKGFAYGPKDVTVKVGQTIAWTNADAAPHTVTAKSGGSFDSGTMAKGASFEFKAAEAGTVEYFCAIHPSMTASITVQ